MAFPSIQTDAFKRLTITTSLDLNRSTNTGTVAVFRYARSIEGNISVTASSTTYNSTSDYRTKENITPLEHAADTIRALRPVTYTAISDGQWYDGFLAHEVQEIIPTAVTGEKDGEEMQSMDYAKLTPLTAALQEALNKIDVLEAQNAAFETRLAALEP